MSSSRQSQTTAVLTGAGRGFGAAIATVLPQLTPATELGAEGVAAYAERQGIDTDSQDEHREYQFTGHGLHAMV
jgi:NAD(P)-dependent dehydrogenase (short-subunit alcohol dehydrogenase family)